MQKKNFIGFRDRILLHLLRFEKDVYDNIHGDEVDGLYKDFLFNLTQEGIAANVGTKQSTIYKELQTLRNPTLPDEEPLIKMIDKVRIPGKERACSIYYLSHYGHDLAEQATLPRDIYQFIFISYRGELKWQNRSRSRMSRHF